MKKKIQNEEKWRKESEREMIAKSNSEKKRKERKAGEK